MDDLSDTSLRTEFELFLKQCELSKEKAMIDTNGYSKEQVYCLDRRCVTNIKMITLKHIYIEKKIQIIKQRNWRKSTLNGSLSKL